MAIHLALAQVEPAANALAVATDVAIIAIAVTILVLLFLGIALVRKTHRVLNELSATAKQNFAPVSDRARAISDNVEFITQSVRADVQQLNGSVKALTDRLHLASNRMEERIEEFNALMEVVQDEAEDLFIGTASAVRGVREGARTIASPREPRSDDRVAVPTDGAPADTEPRIPERSGRRDEERPGRRPGAGDPVAAGEA